MVSIIMEQRATTHTEPINKQTLAGLEALGLNKSEAKIYTVAIQLGRTNVSAIARKTGINRRNIYDTLSTLIDKGLIFQIIGEREGTYAAVEPSKLLELIQTKELALESIMPSLEQRFASPSPGENAVIYKGIDGFKNYLEDILTTEKDVYCLSAKGGWGFAELGDFADWFEQEQIRKKSKYLTSLTGKCMTLNNKKTTLRYLCRTPLFAKRVFYKLWP